MDSIIYFIFISNLLRCQAASLDEQIEHIARRQQESNGLTYNFGSLSSLTPGSRRLYFQYDPHDVSTIIGAPSMASHLPEAEPILPGHTLIRPALGMLKSAVKFPHRELEGGSGVMGNMNNIGLRYDGRNERVMYSGFRRSQNRPKLFVPNPDNYRKSLSDYIMVVPSAEASDPKIKRPRFTLTNLVLDMDKRKDTEKKVKERLKILSKPVEKKKRLLLYVANPNGAAVNWHDLLQPSVEERIDVRSPENDINIYFLQPQDQFRKHRDKRSPKTSNRIIIIRRQDDIDEEKVEFDIAHTGLKLKSGTDLEEMQYPKVEQKKMSKMESLLATKDMYNNVRISQDALDFRDLIPESTESSTPKGRQWWFFNQIDFKPFPKEE